MTAVGLTPREYEVARRWLRDILYLAGILTAIIILMPYYTLRLALRRVR